MSNQIHSLKQLFVKSKIKFSLFLALVLILLGGVISFLGLLAGNFSREMFYVNHDYVSDIKMESISALPPLINFDCNASRIVLKQSQDKNITVEYDANLIDFDCTEDHLKIRSSANSPKYSGYKWYRTINNGIIYTPEEVILNIPKGYSGDIELQVPYGDISFAGIDAASISVSSNNGDIELSEVTAAKNLRVNSEYGRMKLDNINCARRLDLESSNGNISLKNISAEDFQSDNQYGSTTIEYLDTETLSVMTNNGDIDLSSVNADSSIFINDYGLSSLSDVSGKELELNSGSGEIELANVMMEDYIRAECQYGDIRLRDSYGRNMILFSENGSIKGRINAPKSSFDIIYNIGSYDDAKFNSGGSSLLYGTNYGSTDISFQDD